MEKPLVRVADFDDLEVLATFLSESLELRASAMLADSTAWFGYVKSQEGMAWKYTLILVDKLKAPFALASQHDPSLVSRYPALARRRGHGSKETTCSPARREVRMAEEAPA
jgi:hypothetical protein